MNRENVAEHALGTWYLVAFVCVLLTIASAIHPFLSTNIFVFVGFVSLVWSAVYAFHIFKPEMDGILGIVAIIVLAVTIYAWKRYDALAHLGIFHFIAHALFLQ